ncbi:HTH-like domain-containing protein [Duffyella gerundensis]|uniref:HTH-like domain-containing protein n=1 Tax=Duffyella TaxID=3026546 RepID=UPI003F6E3002
MTKEQKIFAAIKEARSKALDGEKTAELHLQLIKYADDLKHLDRKAICEELGIEKSYAAEIGKMRNIIDRLKSAGLDTAKI